jgi:hypothetical protein
MDEEARSDNPISLGKKDNNWRELTALSKDICSVVPDKSVLTHGSTVALFHTLNNDEAQYKRTI